MQLRPRRLTLALFDTPTSAGQDICNRRIHLAGVGVAKRREANDYKARKIYAEA